jgi:putative ABC transport system permease protein
MMVDYDFFATYDIGLVAGRTFDPARNDRFSATNTTGGYILNMAAVREFGLQPDEVIGTTIEFLFRQGPVIGVVEDANFESVRNTIQPMLFSLPREGDPAPLIATIRLTGNKLGETLQYVDETWRKFMPEYPVQRHFLNEDFEALYKNEQRQGDLFGYFAQLAISIACLGLYGLSVFNTERRRREIGVRKVMGGSVWSIVLLLTNDFSKLVLLSNLIAWPVAYFAMNRWLENFAYRIDLTPLIFIGSGLIALCIAWVTVGGTAAKAASAKPVLALRYE